MKQLKFLIAALLVIVSFGSFAQTTDTVAIKVTVTDPHNFPTTVKWVQISGPTATIVSPNSANTVVRNIKEGTSVFRGTATNSYGASSYADVTVVAVTNEAPVIIANPNRFEITLPAK